MTFAALPVGESLRVPLGPLPIAPAIFTIQVVRLFRQTTFARSAAPQTHSPNSAVSLIPPQVQRLSSATRMHMQNRCGVLSLVRLWAVWYVLSISGLAQSHARLWGDELFLDTEIYRTALARVYCLNWGGRGFYAMTPAGELFCVGSVAGGVPPTPPPGSSYVRVARGATPIAQLSNGSLVNLAPFAIGATQPTATPALPSGMSWLSLASTLHQAFALRSDGVIANWGVSFAGLEVVPTLSSGLTYTSVVAGPYDAAALVSDGSIRAWGLGYFQPVPQLPSGVLYVQIAAGATHILALRSDGQVVGWGSNNWGEASAPSLPFGLTYTSIRAGEGYSVAQRSDGKWIAWGRNDVGQCDIPLLPGGSWLDIQAGPGITAAVTSSGSLQTWGWLNTPPPLPAGMSLVHHDASVDDCLVVRSDGTIESRISRLAPGPAPALPQGVRYRLCAAGADVCFGLASDGSIRSWGVGSWGEEVVPQLPVGMTYTDLDCFSQTAVALRSDGTAVAWGRNTFSQASIPAPPAGTTYTEVASGELNTMLLVSDGSLVVTGSSVHGLDNAPSPTLGVRYVKIACGLRIAAR